MRSEKQILEEREVVRVEMDGYLKKAGEEKRAFTPEEEAFFQKADAKYVELTAERDSVVRTNQAAAKVEEYRVASQQPSTAVVPSPVAQSVAQTHTPDQRSAMTTWMKYGLSALSDEQRNILRPLEYRRVESRGTATQITTNDPLGGYLVPDQWGDELFQAMKWYGGALQACKKFDTDTGGPHHKPTLDDTATVGAIIAQGVADVVSDLTFAEIIWQDYTYTSKLLKFSLEEIQDSKYNIISEVNDICANRLGRILNTHFTTGDNTGKPQGLVPGSGLGKLAADDITFTRGELIDLMHSVDKAYRNGPQVGFMFHDTILAALKKLAFGSGDDRPLWQPSMREGEPDRIEGFPYWVNNDMDTFGLSKKIMLFGDFSKYLIRQIGGFNLARSTERYFEERAVAFFMYCRFDGRYLYPGAVKHLLTAAA